MLSVIEGSIKMVVLSIKISDSGFVNTLEFFLPPKVRQSKLIFSFLHKKTCK